jgi:hypothetical protein
VADWDRTLSHRRSVHPKRRVSLPSVINGGCRR